MNTRNLPSTQTQSALKSLWRGTGQQRAGLTALMWAVIRWVLAGLGWGFGVQLAYLPAPLKTAGAVVGVLSLLGMLWGGWAAWRGIYQMGVRNLLLTLVSSYLLLVAFNVLTVPDNRPWSARVFSRLLDTGGQIGAFFGELANNIRQAPDDFLLAYTGQAVLPPLPAGFPTPDPEAQAPSVIAQPQVVSVPKLKIGGYALINMTESQTLCEGDPFSVEPTTPIRFPIDERLLILAGPKSDGEWQWWKVYTAQTEGWCVEAVLQATR